MAEELGAVVGLGNPDGQGVAGGLGRSDPDDRAETGRRPCPGDLGERAGLAGPGRRVDHRHALAVGQRRQRRRSLVLAQPRLGGLRGARIVGPAGQRVLEPRQVRAERLRGVGASHARRALLRRLRDHSVFHGQLRAGGVAHAAVPPVDAAPVSAQQAARHLGRLGSFQAQDRLELRRQRAVSQLFKQRPRLSRVPAVPRQYPAQVLEHVCPGPGALLLLRQRHCSLSGAPLLQLGRDRFPRVGVARLRANAARVCVPYRRRDRRERDAERAREPVRPIRVQLREVERAFLALARGEVRRLRQLRELPLRRGAPVPPLELRRSFAQRGGDRFPARGEQAHHLPADALDLVAVSVVAHHPLQAEPAVRASSRCWAVIAPTAPTCSL